MKPLVSILIPCYNAESWLPETLESALGQTWENIEVIVVDDGSTDNSLAVAKKFESSKVKVISQHNQGASVARNRALQEAQGDFIQYLDADDLLAPDKIEHQVKLLNCDRNSDYIVSCAWARFYQTPAEAVFQPQPIWQDMLPVEWLICAWEENWMMHPAVWLIPRQIAETIGFWNESLSLYDDGEYFCRAILASQKVKFCQASKTYYRSGNTNSLSGLKSFKAWQSGFLSLELSTNNLLALENTARTQNASAMCFQRFVYDAYPHAPELVKKAQLKVASLGGVDLPPPGGTRFQLMCRLFGWKLAKRIQQFLIYLQAKEWRSMLSSTHQA